MRKFTAPEPAVRPSEPGNFGEFKFEPLHEATFAIWKCQLASTLGRRDITRITNIVLFRE